MRGYRALLRLLPASFRSEYGDDMLAVFERRHRDAQGPFAWLGLWIDALRDVAPCALHVQLDVLRQDLRYVARSLRRAPGFALTVVAVTALGVGATTAAFSITDHVLLRPLPFPESGRLVQLWQNQKDGYSQVELSPANFRDWQRMSTSFEAMGAYYNGSVNLVGDGGEPARLVMATVTAEVLPLVGTRPLLGRSFAPEEDMEGAPGSVVLSYGLWQERFAADPGVVGRTLLLDDAPHQVIGVMPRGYHFPRRETRLWLPMRFDRAALQRRDDLYLECVARLRKTSSLESARAELSVVTGQLERQYPNENKGIAASAVNLRDQLTRQSRTLVLALFGASLGMALIACTNLASLFLARALERRKELAVRTALGAGRERLLRQLLTESLSLAALGGAVGMALAFLALPLVVRLVPNALPIGAMPPVDLRVLGFAALMTLVTAIGFGVAPVLRGLGDGTAAGLREGARAIGSGRERLRSALVVAEVAVSVVLLISSGLLIRALLRVQAVDPGFQASGVVTLRTTLPMPKYEAMAARHAFHSGVLEAARAIPGVTSAGYISFLPLVMGGGIWAIEAEGHQAQPDEGRTASIRYLTPGYFATLGIPIVSGREVSEADSAGTLQVAVVSQSFVDRYWPGQDAIGRRFRFGLLGGEGFRTIGPFQERTVVGVVRDVKVRGLERRSEPQVYLPSRQQPENAMSWYTPQDLAVKHTGDAALVVPALRRAIARLDSTLPVADVRTLETIVEAQTAPRRIQVRVLAGFAAVAVLLAGVGIHGLLAFVVATRSQEIGVRRALGARTRDILDLVLGQGLRLGALGIGFGLLLGYAAARGLEALLAGVSPGDAATFGAAGGLAVGTAFLGSLLPAWRATRVDPLKVMRVE